MNCNIKAPYKLILDGNFLAASVRFKVPLVERLTKLLQGNEFQIYTTRSALEELNSLPGEAFQKARQFGLDECIILEKKDILKCSTEEENIKGSPIDQKAFDPKEDIVNLVQGGNAQGYFVATQDEKLSDKIRERLAYVPQMRMARGGVLIFESPSANSRRHAMREERGKQNTGGGTMTKEEKHLIDTLREERIRAKREQQQQARNGTGGRKKRKAKGPNPLSCKKKKSSGDAKSNSTASR